MKRISMAAAGGTVLVMALPLLAARTAPVAEPAMGPPWMSVEMPANPLDPVTRGAAFVVRTYRHDRPEAGALSGTAEGIVGGERRSIELRFTATGRPGVFKVDQTWPDTGAWILAISSGENTHLLIELGEHGGVQRTSYYGQDAADLSLRSIKTVTGRLPERQIDRALTSLAMGN